MRKIKKVQLTKLQKRKILNLYCRGILNKEQIYKAYGWTLKELYPDTTVSEEHYLIRCPKCQSHNIAMYRHYSNVGVIRVSALCRECHTRASGKTYLDAMVAWNKEQVVVTH